ncbi:MAG: hypothetical protein ABSB35_15920 [Bryobacteraceae bacterium]|jgi:hypothetical protein
MRLIVGLLVSSCLLLAGVDGTVFNATTGQPQPLVAVSLVQPGASGMQTLGSAKSDAEGKFKIDKDYPPGPALVQAFYQGATYTMVLTPGTPTSGLRVDIYDSTKDSGSAKIAQDMLMLERTADALQIRETVFLQNDTKMTFQDPAKGSARFYLPPSVEGKVQVTVNPPGGMPIQRPAEKTTQPDIYKVVYPVRPGQTSFDINYSLPAAEKFSGKNPHPGVPIDLVTPPTVTLSGDGLQALGQEPKTQARVYGFTGDGALPSYNLTIEGTGSLRSPEATQDEDTGSPKVEEAPARLYSQLPWVLGLTLGILFLGGALLYRKGTA